MNQAPNPLQQALEQLLEPALVRRLNRFWLYSALLFGSLTLLLFGDLLFTSRPIVVSFPGNDLHQYYLPCAVFTFDQVQHGNFPLWNPHILSGNTFTTMLCWWLYPFHYLFLFLPAGLAFNWLVALHVFMAGWFTALWCRRRGGGPGGSLLTGVVFMFSGAFFRHLFPGHVEWLAAASYTPLILLAIDGILATGSRGYLLLGSAAVALQCLTSYAQLVYYSGLAAVLYTGLQLLVSGLPAGARLRCAGLIAGFYCAGAALAMAALLPPALATGESVRAGGMTLEYAGICSLPPESLLTAIAPDFFGALPRGFEEAPPDGFVPFFGRWYAWEATMFVGAAALFLAGYGAFRGERPQRRFLALLAALFTILAMGKYVPWVAKTLFHWLPGYALFRAHDRFNLIVALLVAMLAGLGFDRLCQPRQRPWLPAASAGALALLLLCAGLWLKAPARLGPTGAWTSLLQRIAEPGVSRAGQLLQDPAEAAAAAALAGDGLLWAAAFLGAAAVLALLMGANRLWALGLLGVVIVEMFGAAWQYRAWGPLDYPPDYPAWAQAQSDPELRVLRPSIWRANFGMMRGGLDVFGCETFASRRYAQLFAAAQGAPPGELDHINFMLVSYVDVLSPLLCRLATEHGQAPASLTQDEGVRLVRTWVEAQTPRAGPSGRIDLTPWLPPPLVRALQMFRCDTVLMMDANGHPLPDAAGQPLVCSLPNPLPHLQLLDRYVVRSKRDDILKAVLDPAFDPRSTAVLETQPQPPPATGAGTGSATLVRSSTDWLEITATLPRPMLLLVTDSYSKDWRAEPVGAAGPQPRYQVLPANYAQRAIPLAAGHHHLRLRYAPPGWPIGKWTSLISLLAWLVTCALWLRATRPLSPPTARSPSLFAAAVTRL